MAEKSRKFPQNEDGPFYVDENCISCGLCMATAPDNFKFTVGDKHAYVYKQPESNEERELCVEALESCPVEAIGDDG